MAKAKPKSPAKIKRPVVFEFHDYRAFLKDWLVYLKKQHKTSARELARLAGLASGYLPMILSGKRDLSDKALVALQPHLKLRQNELGFFKELCLLSDSTEQSERLECYKRIRRFYRYNEQHGDSIEAHKYLENWYYVAIRELAMLPGFDISPSWIRSQLLNKVTKSQVQEALDFLVENNYLKVDNKGRVVRPEKPIRCHQGVYRLSMSQFHRQILELAADSIYEVPRDQRHLLSHTMAIPRSKFAQVRDVLDEALAKIEAITGEASAADSVYQVSLMSFPLAGAAGSEGGQE
ncbi:MAG: DUF4423 domain-containing protein [Bdellovibrionaceae bacterium]|nr:DUF4423 domain-containing protein [Bdellovibrionales bacterium]MCB9084453.1 DUF4423 domain-containing protein [Pseudobdellovibrionaceae bacterium]